MGRYTTVQTYTDQDAKVAAISYSSATAAGADSSASASATSPTQAEAPAAPADDPKSDRFHINRVDNVAGSSAGAGSGEFHMYRAARRREMERIATMEKQFVAKQQQDEFSAKRKRNADEFEARAHKRSDKRKRRKERQKARALDAAANEDEQADADGKETEKHETEPAVLPTPGGVAEIPNDGSFLERMLAQQKAKEAAGEGEE